MTSCNAYGRATNLARRRHWVLVASALSVGLGVGGYALAGAASGTARHQGASVVSHVSAVPHAQRPSARAVQSDPAVPGALAPNGTYTTPSGAAASIASLRGRPAMVWFVAGGCASCAASIPAVAAHLGQLTRGGLRVLTLGLYGYFSPGRRGVAELLSFGRAAAGGSVTRPGWSWGLASEALSIAYDPEGVPDLYFLISSSGHIRYRNTGPVSTMPQLLAEAARLTGTHVLTSHVQSAPAVPCC